MGFTSTILLPHRAVPAPGVRAFAAGVSWARGRRFAACFRIEAEIGRLRLDAPAGARGARTDDLWKHTCFEIFVRAPGRRRYLELNLSPTGAWAAYSFSSYRKSRSDAAVDPEISVQLDPGEIELEAFVDLQPWLDDAPDYLDVGLAAVLEEDDGRLSYWAVHHPGAEPDFHDAKGHVLRIQG